MSRRKPILFAYGGWITSYGVVRNLETGEIKGHATMQVTDGPKDSLDREAELRLDLGGLDQLIKNLQRLREMLAARLEAEGKA